MTWLASLALAGLPDLDDDGIPDHEDTCVALEETANGYADHDGCPDYLTPVVAVAEVNDTVVPARFRVTRADRSPSPWLAERLGTAAVGVATPGETVHVEARRGCLEGSATVRVGASVEEVRVPLRPVYDATMQIRLPDATPLAGPVQVRVTSSAPAACAPVHVAQGTMPEVRLGAGTHTVVLEVDGREVWIDTVVASGRATLMVPAEALTGIGSRERLDETPLVFPTDASRPLADSVAEIERIASAVATSPAMIEVIGYADERGPDGYNDRLALERARTVANQLARAGVPSDRIAVRSRGELAPAVDGTGPTAWAHNRRVEVWATTPVRRAIETTPAPRITSRN